MASPAQAQETDSAKPAAPASGSESKAQPESQAKPTSQAKPASQAKPGPAGDKTHEVEGVTVNGAAPAMQTSIDRRSYSLAKDLQAQTGSLADALRNIPSVQVDLQGNVSLRGSPNVTILVDGNPSGVFQGPGRSTALQSIPASRFERVEVITNPSAEFSASGTAIINLVTKKAQGIGRTGGLQITAADPARVQAVANAGYNSKALSMTGDLTLRHAETRSEVSDERKAPDPASGDIVDADHESAAHQLGDAVFAHGAVDYDVTAKSRLSGSLRISDLDTETKTANAFTTADALGPIQQFVRPEHQDLKQFFNEATGSWRQKFDGDGHELVTFARREDYTYRLLRDSEDVFSTPVAAPDFNRFDYRGRFIQSELKSDYTRPMSDSSKLKLGFDFEDDDQRYNFIGKQGPAPGALSNDPLQTNLFLYKRDLLQAYATYERKFGDLSVLGGLRLQVDNLDLDQVTEGVKASPSDTHLFPSLHMAYRLTDTQTATASYSRRVAYPDPALLNPFRVSTDPFNFQAGNIDLAPQISDSYEVGYQYTRGDTYYLASAHFVQVNHSFTSVVQDLGGDVFLTTQENLDTSRSGGLELVAAGPLIPKVTYNLSANLFWNEINAANLGFSRARSTYTAMGQGNLSWQITPKDLVQINAFVTGESLTPQGHTAPTGMLNLGFRHKLSDRISVLATVQDVLRTYHSQLVLDTPALSQRVERSFDTRTFALTLVWNFGGQRKNDPGFQFENGASAPH
ncbi:TonB-dependent receptor domain-containing protein [Phenylobacterium sp.]|jgi:outer membrane receptor protein involved in Fe transport|uniref:TonB-dependent receptor domain-containing protein n=1 Tax=Phenylobacterium sp. TaxID=1871053 RepID=UPI002F40BE27